MIESKQVLACEISITNSDSGLLNVVSKQLWQSELPDSINWEDATSNPCDFGSNGLQHSPCCFSMHW